MLAFDPSSYMKSVLAPVAGTNAVPDMFARYCLDPSDYLAGARADAGVEREIETRLGEVKAHWEMLQGRNNVKYAELLKRLVREHGLAQLTLLDLEERRRSAETQHDEKTTREAAIRKQEEQFGRELAEVLARNNGLTSRGRRMLEEYARHLGLNAEAVAARLDSCPVVTEHTGSQALPENIRVAIRKALDVYAAAMDNPAKGVSLFHALGLSAPEYDPALIKASFEDLGRELRQWGSDHPVNAPLKAVLGLVNVHLVEGDPAVYMASLVLDVREALRPMAAGHAIDDDAIDELEAEQLVRAAQERGLPTTEARDLVADLASDLKVRLLMGAAVDYIACPRCNRPHPAASAPDRCSRCGGSLFRACPSCNARCPANDQACYVCGTDVAAYARAGQAINDARLAVESGQIAMAAEIVANISVEIADDAGRALQVAIDRAMSHARAEWEVIERKLGERKLYSAVSLLAHLEERASDVVGPSGLTSSDRRASIAQRLHKVEAIVARARSESGATREQSLASALAEAADCREAETELARIPPMPASNVTSVDRGGRLNVEWVGSSSPGPVVYRVIRSNAQASGDIEVAVTEALVVTDDDAPVGQLVRYGVASERAGARSEISWSSLVLLARELRGLTVTERDESVELNWEPTIAGARVELERTDDESGHAERLSPDRAGIVDRGVRNGISYRYRVCVVYPGADGQLVRTDGQTVFATPAGRPQAVSDLSAVMEGASARFRYTKPDRGVVQILRCRERPSVTEGQELTQRELDAIGNALPRDGEGQYDGEPAGLAWYLPISQAGSYLVAGRAIRHLGLPPIADVHAVDNGSSVRITWSWPERTRAAVVVWRRDRQPVNADDEAALRCMVTRAQYIEQGGVEIDAPGAEPIFVAVLAAARIDGELVSASDADQHARVAVRKADKVRVGYAVRRSGFRKRQLVLEILEPSDVLPELVFVAKSGELLPRTVGDGRVVAHLGGRSGCRRQGFDLGDLGLPVAVRLFFQSGATDSTHRLCEPSTSELVFH